MERMVEVQKGGPGRSSKRVRLIVVNECCGIQSFEVASPQFLVGRSPTCQLQLGSPTVSRVHALIQHRDGRTFVRDLETRNGTRHNGRWFHSEEIEVMDGDRLMFGPCLFTVAIEPRREETSSGVEVRTDAFHQDGVGGPASLAPSPGPSCRAARPIIVKLFGAFPSEPGRAPRGHGADA